jgi:multiple sugar transport system permease protein
MAVSEQGAFGNSLPQQTEAVAKKQAKRRRFWSADNPWFWLTPAMAILLFYSIFPLIYNIILSFHEWRTSKKVFEYKELQNWQLLFANADGGIGNALWVTIQYTVICLVVQFTLGLIIALLLDARPWGANIMQTLIILPMVTAPAVAAMLFRLLESSNFGAIVWFLRQVGIFGPNDSLIGGDGRYALIGVALVDIWQWTPFFVLILLAGLKAIPDEIVEASSVDGANWFARLFRIKIPLLGGVLAIAILFRLVDLYKMIDYVFILTAGGPGISTRNLSYYAYVNSFSLIKWGYGATLGVAILILGYLTAVVYQRLFRIKW